MNRDRNIIEHINNRFAEIENDLNSIQSLEDFDKSGVLQRSILFSLFQIGENVNKLSEDFKKKIKDIDYKGIIDIRNHIVHGYGKINITIVYNTIINDLPRLINELNTINDSED